MRGPMQEHPLLVSSLPDHAAKHHRGVKVVSVDAAGAITRGTRRDVAQDAKRPAACYGISGMGAVPHAVKPRLLPDQLAFILEDAADTQLVDPSPPPMRTARMC